MNRRLVILTEIISPYRIPVFNALALSPQVSLHVVFLAETDPHLRQWQVYKEEIRFSYEVLPSWRARIGRYKALFNKGVARALVAASPDVILCGGYNYAASWQALVWARIHGVPFFLWSESNLHDLREGHTLVEFLKSQFIFSCSGFVLPGRSALEYLCTRKISKDSIFTAPNAVDNDRFANIAAIARQNSALLRSELCLHNRYFLFVGRLVKEKGVFDLLAAYSRLDERIRQRIGLVIVGDGMCRQQLEEDALSITPGMVKFAGFAQREQLGAYYSLADMLIFPTHSDPWGLVVNEAMACGLPIILSRIAGCAADLVMENWNGVLVKPKDVSSLASAMERLASQPKLCATMGANSMQHISRYSPEEWSAGVVRAIRANAADGNL